MQKLQSKLQQFVLPSGKFSHKKAKAFCTQEDLNMLEELTNFLPIESKFSQRCICILKNIIELPKCEICNTSHANYSCGNFGKTCGNKQCVLKLRISKATQTMKQQCTYEKIAIKTQLAMLNPEIKKKHSQNISNALNTPDCNGITPSRKAAQSLKETLAKNPSIASLREPKRRATMEQTGKWLTYAEYDLATAYRLKVHNITMKQPLHLLENFNLRGPSTSDINVQNYHIDHIFSVIDGFKNNVPPEIIGHICNLRMLHHKENVRKNSKSDITIEELYFKYQMAQSDF